MRYDFVAGRTCVGTLSEKVDSVFGVKKKRERVIKKKGRQREKKNHGGRRARDYEGREKVYENGCGEENRKLDSMCARTKESKRKTEKGAETEEKGCEK